MKKYESASLIPALRLFIVARNTAIEHGVTDNGGAIHSVERILDILSRRIRYSYLTSVGQLKGRIEAEMSVAAHKARLRGEKVSVEHVLPQRAYALKVVTLLNFGATDGELIEYIQARYRLVLLTTKEKVKLSRLDRSRLEDDRLRLAGIAMMSPNGHEEP